MDDQKRVVFGAEYKRYSIDTSEKPEENQNDGIEGQPFDQCPVVLLNAGGRCLISVQYSKSGDHMVETETIVAKCYPKRQIEDQQPLDSSFVLLFFVYFDPTLVEIADSVLAANQHDETDGDWETICEQNELLLVALQILDSVILLLSDTDVKSVCYYTGPNDAAYCEHLDAESLQLAFETR